MLDAFVHASDYLWLQFLAGLFCNSASPMYVQAFLWIIRGVSHEPLNHFIGPPNLFSSGKLPPPAVSQINVIKAGLCSKTNSLMLFLLRIA